MNTNKYTFSKHAKKRFLERFWHTLPKGADVMEYLEYAISHAREERSFLNNTAYMSYVYERHGYKGYICLCYEDMLFLVIEGNVVTILNVSKYPLQRNKKYKKDKSKMSDEYLYGAPKFD